MGLWRGPHLDEIIYAKKLWDQAHASISVVGRREHYRSLNTYYVLCKVVGTSSWGILTPNL